MLEVYDRFSNLLLGEMPYPSKSPYSDTFAFYKTVPFSIALLDSEKLPNTIHLQVFHITLKQVRVDNGWKNKLIGMTNADIKDLRTLKDWKNATEIYYLHRG